MQYILIISFILLVLLYDFFAKYLHINIIDELLVGFFLVWSLYLKLKFKIKLEKIDKIIFFSYVLIVLLGLISSIYYRLQPIKIVIIDFIIISKFFIVFLSMRIILLKKVYNYNLKKLTIYFLTSVFVVLLVLILLDETFIIFPTFDHKYFDIGSEELFFGHPSRFAFIIEMIIIILLPSIKKNTWIIFLILLIASIGILSLRSKYFIFIFILMIFILMLKMLNIKKISLTKIMLFSSLFIFIGYTLFYEDLMSQFLIRNDGSQGVRGLLLLSGFNISLNNFPLGAGFGSFGSYASTISYSPLYYQYHFDIIPGCMPEKPSFLADNFFAMLLGEFGLFGTGIFLYVFYLLLSILLKAFNRDTINRYYYTSALLALFILFFESFSDSIISQNRGIFIAIYLSFIVTKASLFFNKKAK